MSELLRFFKDMRDNGYGLAEIAAQLGTSAIAEPVAGFAAMYDPAHGADAIREGMTYQPRSQEAQEYSQSIGNAAKTAIKPAMPIIDTWKKGVDIAGQYSPVIGAGLRTVPTAIGIAMGAKPALQAGRQVSEGLGAMQGRMIANANAPRTLNAGYMGQRGAIGTQRPLTEFEQAHATAQRNAALPVENGGLGLPADNTAMDRARAMGFDYARRSQSSKTPFNDVDYGMFVKHGGDIESSLDDISQYGKGQWLGLADVNVEDVKKEILKAIRKSGVNNDYGTTAAKLTREAMPDDIVNSAGSWDAPDIAEKIINDLYDKGIKAVKTPDGAIIWDKSNIRSIDAAFDPFNRDSSNLLAQSAKLAPTTALGAYMYNEKRKKSQGNQ